MRNILKRQAIWRRKSIANIEKWGIQDIRTLLLCMTEELGELTQATLHFFYENGDIDDIDAELDDLAALCYSFIVALDFLVLEKKGRENLL